MTIRPDQIQTYNHLPAGHPDNPYTYAICGAIKSDHRAEVSGSPVCLQAAGYGTDHLGVGRCKHHGGASLSGTNHPRFIHGRRSKKVDAMRRAFQEKARAEEELTGNSLDLLAELEIQRHLLYLFLTRQSEHHNFDMPALLEMGEALPDPDTIEEMMGGKRQETEEVPLNKVIEYTYQMVNDIVKTSTAITTQRKETMLTITEIKYLQQILKETFERFISDADIREQAVRWFAERVGS